MPKMKAAVFVEQGHIVLESKSMSDVRPLVALPAISIAGRCGGDLRNRKAKPVFAKSWRSRSQMAP